MSCHIGELGQSRSCHIGELGQCRTCRTGELGQCRTCCTGELGQCRTCHTGELGQCRTCHTGELGQCRTCCTGEIGQCRTYTNFYQKKHDSHRVLVFFFLYICNKIIINNYNILAFRALLQNALYKIIDTIIIFVVIRVTRNYHH